MFVGASTLQYVLCHGKYFDPPSGIYIAHSQEHFTKIDVSRVFISISRVQTASVSDGHRDAWHGLKAALFYLRTLFTCIVVCFQRKFSFVTSLKDFAQYFDCLDDVAFISKGPHEYYKVCFFTRRM